MNMEAEQCNSIRQLQYKKHREKRTTDRKFQTVDLEDNIRISLQNCSTVDENRQKLNSCLFHAKGSKFNFRSILGLMAILDHLECTTIIKFQEAYDIYSSFFEHEPDRTVFRDNILNSDHGLICCYFSNPLDKKSYISIRTNEIQVENVILYLCKQIQENPFDDSKIQPDTADKIISSMDTEYDKQCTKALIISTSSVSNDTTYAYGMNPQSAKKQIDRIKNVADECENAITAAEDIVNLQLEEKINKSNDKLKSLQLTIDKYQNSVSHNQLPFVGDLMEEKNNLEVLIEEQQKLKTQKDSYHIQRFQQAVKRTAKSLINENRVKRRRLGAGPSEKLDEEDEEFLLNCIESKATAHGRRHDSVLYLNHAVRKKNFKSIINFHRTSKGKAPIKSSTTVYNRARPKNFRSLQSKRHRGKWLFSSKKPTKSEEKNKIHTKHQRAHVKRAVLHLCQSDKDLALIHSMDDKAYLKPEASDGLDKFKIFQPVDVTKQRRLPKYDFAQAKLNITPSSHRYFMKEVTSVGNKVEMVMSEDENICVFRPKYYTGSSGSVWASEDRRLRYEKPELYERNINANIQLSNEFHSISAILRDKASHYIQQSMHADIIKATANPECPFIGYEKLRIKSLSSHLEKAIDMSNTFITYGKSEHEKQCFVRLLEATENVTKGIYTVLETLQAAEDHTSVIHMIKSIGNSCLGLLETIDDFELRKIKPRVLELTDGGPGVGKSNRDVRFRAAEKVLIDNLDFYTRIHRASGDCQNEVERTQAAVGKAISDGGSIPWEYKKLDIESDNVKQMSIEEIENLEDEIYKFNVTQTCKDLSRRVENAPGPRGGFMTGLVSYKKDELFFNDELSLKMFLDTAPSKRQTVPGFHYYDQVTKFYETHFTEGELYIEYVRFNCEDTLDSICDFCRKGWSGKPISNVPRPFPDTGSNFQYVKYDETPLEVNGKKRETDDFQPRFQLRKLFNEGKIKSDMLDDIKTFSVKYAIEDESLITAELIHIEMMQFKKEKRMENRKQKTSYEKSRKVDEFDWLDLHSKGKIKDLSVNLLTMYITDKKLCHHIPRKKSEKVSIVEAHITRQKAINQYKKSGNWHDQDKEMETSDTDEDDDVITDVSDEDIELEIGSQSENEEQERPPTVCINRFGRLTSHWKQRKFFGDSESDSD